MHGTRSAEKPSRPRVAALLEESRMAPYEIDLRRVILVGIALWVVAGVVSAILLATGTTDVRLLAISAFGVCLGFLALLWDRRRRQRSTP